MNAKSIMSGSVVTARRKSTVKEISAKMIKNNALCAVVVEKKTPVGIFSGRDLLEPLDSNPDVGNLTMEDVMHPPAPLIRENQDFFTAVRMSGRHDVWRFAVVDEAGNLKGVATETEVLAKFALSTFPFNMRLATFSSHGISASPKNTLKKIISLMSQSRQNCVTLALNHKPAGMVDERTLLKLVSKDALKAEAGKKMTKRMAVCHADDGVREAVLKMLKMKETSIVITNDNGWYQGIIQQNDLVKHIEKTHL